MTISVYFCLKFPKLPVWKMTTTMDNTLKFYHVKKDKED